MVDTVKRKVGYYKLITLDGKEFTATVKDLAEMFGVGQAVIRYWNKDKYFNVAPIESVEFSHNEYIEVPSDRSKYKKRRRYQYNLVDVKRKQFLYEGFLEDIVRFLKFSLYIDLTLKEVAYLFKTRGIIEDRYMVIRSKKVEYISKEELDFINKTYGLEYELED